MIVDRAPFVAASATGFDARPAHHPEFHTTGSVDPGRLKFDHARHLTAGMASATEGPIQTLAMIPEADRAQLAVARRAAERGTPLLGICRGHQIINVALGGTLVQDLGEHSAHRNEGVPVDESMTPHEVELDPSSALAFRLGARHLQVQSAHHQSVGELGEGLRAVAWASDGTVEAIEHRTLPITGVQWHPEDPGTVDDQLGLLLGGLAREAERAAA
jgi:putative glutamine amidotransferase